MAIEKRTRKVWNGVAWIEVYYPTSDDIVVLVDGTTKLRSKLNDLDTDISEHVTDPDIHTSPSDKIKLGNLHNDANATYATKTELTTHEDDDVRHITVALQTKLDNLHNDANATYATKPEVKGKTQVYHYTNIAARNSDSKEFIVGDTCWVSDASADTVNIKGPGSGFYAWDGTQWLFILEADANIDVNWEDIIGLPELDSVEDIEELIEKMHSHTNMAVLNALGKDTDDDLTLNGNKIGEEYNNFYITTPKPTGPLVNDIWMPPVDAVLPPPTDLEIEDDKLSFTGVPNASGYELYVDGVSTGFVAPDDTNPIDLIEVFSNM